ncbi:uncharacterized protein IL334_005815 [Kwoniella shivajii]|uniref:Uncharacterized protein n=1 Tax=Kwoniella shivajii TaxID=564305 RepID=A0ABZ1D5Q2_9TREE|nr:hypothetical protein IL334_005815 [Kwoniella shivajii]
MNKVNEKFTRKLEYAITPQAVECLKSGMIDTINYWNSTGIRNRADDIEDQVHQEYADCKMAEMDSLSEAESEEELKEGTLVGTDGRGRPLIDIETIVVTDVDHFLLEFLPPFHGKNRYLPHYELPLRYLNEYANRAKGLRRIASIKKPAGLLTKEAVDYWLNYVPPAVNYLLRRFPKGVHVQGSEYPHHRWAGDMAAQMVAHYHADQVDTEAIKVLLQRRHVRSTAFDGVTVTYYSSGERLVLYLPRASKYYPGSKKLVIGRAIRSFRTDEPPLMIENPKPLFDTVVIKRGDLDKLTNPVKKAQVERAIRWYLWLLTQVGRRGRLGLDHQEWSKLFHDHLPTCLIDSFQAQQRHLKERWFTFRDIPPLSWQPAGESRFQLIAIQSAFESREEKWGATVPTGIEFRGFSQRSATRYCLWLNERFQQRREVWPTIRDFAIYVDTSEGYANSWMVATGCEHKDYNKTHMCVVCEVAPVKCVNMIPNRGAICEPCLAEEVTKSHQEYLLWYQEMMSSTKSKDGESAVLLSAMTKHSSYKRRLDHLSKKGHSEVSDVRQLEDAVHQFAGDSGDVQDMVFGLGSLSTISKEAGWDNILMRPSVVRKNRAYVQDGKTYLFHQDDILPTIAAAGIMSGGNSLAATDLLVKACRLAQTRWDDVVTQNPDEEGKEIQKAMRKIDRELEDIDQLQLQIPYNMKHLVRSNPQALSETLTKLNIRLQNQLSSLSSNS